VDDVTVFGSLKQFNAGKLDLDNSLTVEDSVQFLTLDDATGTITLGDDANIRNTTVKLDEATDLDLNSLTTLKSVSVDFWAGNDHGIAATKIDSLSSQHDFDAGVVVNMGDYHAFDSGTVLGSVSIGRNLTGGSWAVQGNVNKFAVKGTTDDLTFTVAENTTAGNVTEMNFNYITSADVTVDNKITRVSAKHWLAGNLAADSIERLTVSGTQGFGADLMLYGDNVAANDYALKYMTVNSWLGNQAGESTVAVLGKVYNATIGAIKNANFFVGTTSDPDQLSDFDAAHPTIHSLTLNGIKVGASKQYLEDATVAAYGFDKLTFAGRNAVLHTASVKTRASGITKLVNTPATDEADWLVTLV
jgi:hypothetical protein